MPYEHVMLVPEKTFMGHTNRKVVDDVWKQQNHQIETQIEKSLMMSGNNKTTSDASKAAVRDCACLYPTERQRIYK